MTWHEGACSHLRGPGAAVHATEVESDAGGALVLLLRGHPVRGPPQQRRVLEADCQRQSSAPRLGYLLGLQRRSDAGCSSCTARFVAMEVALSSPFSRSHSKAFNVLLHHVREMLRALIGHSKAMGTVASSVLRQLLLGQLEGCTWLRAARAMHGAEATAAMRATT